MENNVKRDMMTSVLNSAPSDIQNVHLLSALQITINTNLISNAKYLLRLLQKASSLSLLSEGPVLVQAVRRYRTYWLPLAAQFEDILPPIDVQWVWFCHCLNSKSYRSFCELHYSKIISVPTNLAMASESSARDRCIQLWRERYPNEPFDIEKIERNSPTKQHNLTKRRKQISQICRSYLPEEREIIEITLRETAFFKEVSQPYVYHDSFLKVAEDRYKSFLYLVYKQKAKTIRVLTSDIHLMWTSHKICPQAYIYDIRRLCGSREEMDFQILSEGNLLQDFLDSSKTWEEVFGYPYERAGAMCQSTNIACTTTPVHAASGNTNTSTNWRCENKDINTRHESLNPRFIVEVCIHMKGTQTLAELENASELFLQLRMMEACKSLRQYVPIANYISDNEWHKLWSMQCELTTNGLNLELRSRRINCLNVFSQLLKKISLTWRDLETDADFASKTLIPFKRDQMIESLIIYTSITPPVQAPYLLKALCDRVTDDTGAMLSKKFLILNKFKPQEGRWMSRTVLDHTGKECFIIRIRVAAGIWRKNERPVGVDWNDRVIHIHAGGWNYISGSIGIAPDKILATATPVGDELENYKMKWSFSTGETLTIQMLIEHYQWERNLQFSVKGNSRGMVRLMNGRCKQYDVPSAVPEEEEGFVTLVRYTPESHEGRATALFNWKMTVMEVSPEEDVIFVMLLCIATQRTVVDLGGKIFHNPYRRRTIKRQMGERDWGSVLMEEGPETPRKFSCWYANPEEVLGINLDDISNEEVLPKGASYTMYRGTSWLYAGSSRGLYNLSSKGSCESMEDRIFGLHFGSQTKFPTFSH